MWYLQRRPCQRMFACEKDRHNKKVVLKIEMSVFS
jgi:hypothetical protein